MSRDISLQSFLARHADGAFVLDVPVSVDGGSSAWTAAGQPLVSGARAA